MRDHAKSDPNTRRRRLPGRALAAAAAAALALAGAPALALAGAPALATAATARAASLLPRDGSTLLYLIGAGATFNTANQTVSLHATEVENLRSSGTSGPLKLTLWATTSVPDESQGVTGYELASYSLGKLPAGGEISVNSGQIPYSPPPSGCYYLSLVLLESNLVADLRTVANGGTPQANAYDLFAFGSGQTCPAATSCTPGATNGCLLGGRFMVTAAYGNLANGHGAGSVLLFGSTRAESDESVFFYFTDPSNFEMGVKVLDACSITNSFWIFLGGLTNQGFGVNVLDTATGNVKHYDNLYGTTTVTTTDTTGLPCP